MIPARGEVWIFDLGMEGEIRPVLVVSMPYGDLDRTLITISAYHQPPRISI
jgi:mRNA-degrading endonuclease toxin of MazEF toxin-antitoxin module